MKHLKLFFACMLMAVLSIGQVWADDPAAAGTTLFSENFSGYAKDAVPSGEVTTATGRVVYGGANVTYSVTNGGGTTKIYEENTAGGTSPEILVGKSNGTLTIAGIPSGGAKAITVSYKQNKQKLKVESTTTGYSGSKDEKPSSVGANSVDITIADGSAETFTLVFTCTGSSNVRVDDILVTVKTAGEGGAPAKTLSSVAVSGTPTKTSYYAGDNFDPAGLTVTGTYSDASTSPITSGITWSYDPSQELSLNQTSIGVIATVSEIASSKFNVTGLTVTEAPAAVNYEKVTAEPADWSGEYILVYESGSNAYVYTGVDANNNYAAATISNDVIAIPEGAATLTIASMEGGYSIRLGGGTNDGKYISGTSGTNTTKFTADPVANTLSIANGSAVITAGNTIRFNSGSSTLRFRYYGATAQQAVQLYKKVDGTVKPSAELSYATADQKKLAKLGNAFSAPALINPHTVAVTYGSNNTSVAEVNASTGAVTIKAAGVATITASFAGNDDYKEGSASYTIGVTTHAGTSADPYVAADAKIAVDVMGTVANAYASGIVSSIYSTSLGEGGFITFYFSADGLTSGQQIEAYKCYGLNSAAFEAVTDVKTGATVVVTGTLKKYNSTYEFDQNCHLVSYEAPAVPKTHIANTKETAYTVAQALVYAADGVTYDLDDYVYVQGVVYDVKNFNNGAMDIFIKDADAENSFELFKCAGINDGSATTPFEALTDVQEGDIVIGYGQLTVYNSVSEFKQGNYLVDLDRPDIAVTSVELNATATVKVGNSINLSASVLPANATDKVIEWSIQSGNANITLNNGTVTGVAEGTAVVRATSHADNTKYAECTITIEAADPVYAYYNYEKVTATADIEDGEYLIVYEGDETHDAAVFDGSLDTDNLDKEKKVITVEIADNMIVGTTALHAATFTIDVTAGTIKSASGLYIGKDAYANGLDKSSETAYTNTIAISEGIAVITSKGNCTLRYNYASDQLRFRYYKSGQQAVQLYKKVGTNEAPKANPQLAWDPADDIEITVGDAFSAPALLNPNNIAAAEITIASNNTDLATVTNGVVALVANATGEATITATFAGNDDYKPATVSYNITVKAAPASATSGNVVILAEYGNKVYAMSNSLSGGALAGVEVKKEGDKIVVASAADKAAIQWTATVDGDNTTLKNADDKYIKGSDGASLSLDNAAYNWNWDGEKSCYISSEYTTRGLFFSNSGNVFKGYALTNITGNGYAAIEVKEIAAENIVVVELQSITISGTATNLTYTDGQSFNPAGLVVTGHYSDNTNAEITTGINWSYDPDPLTEGTTSVSVTAAIGTISSSAFVVNGLAVESGTPAPQPTSGNVVIIAVYDSKFYALTNSISNKTAAAVVVEKDGDKIVVSSQADKDAIQWNKTVDGENTTFQDADDNYLKGVSNGGDLTLVTTVCNWSWDGTNNCYAIGSRSFIYRESANGFKNYSIGNAGSSDYSAIAEVIEIAPENIVISSKADPELAYTPAEVTLTVGNTFTPSVLSYAEGFDGLTAVTYASNNESVATVNESGVVSLVADATGTATITATFAGNSNYLAGNASYTITVNEVGDDLSGTWVLASSVAVGDKIIIGGTYNNDTKTMGAQNQNNRAAVASTLAEDVLTPGIGTKVFTIVDAGDGKFAIKASNGKYLNAAGSGTSNYLRESDDFSTDNAKWTITFDENGANVVASSNNRNVIRYNSSNGSELFSCYAAGGQKAINIYKIQEAAPEPETYTVTFNSNGGSEVASVNVEEGQAVVKPTDPTKDDYNFVEWQLSGVAYDFTTPVTSDITLDAVWEAATTPVEPEPNYTRNVTAGRYGTICLPNGGTIKGAAIFEIAYKADGLIYFDEVAGGIMVPGMPYVFLPNAAQIAVFYNTEDPANDPENKNGLYGSFAETKIDINAGNYILYNNKYYLVDTEAYVGANRAYIKMDDIPTTPSAPAPGRRRVAMEVNGEQVATSTLDIEMSNQPTKVVIDNNLYIIREGKMYDMTGRVVK